MRFAARKHVCRQNNVNQLEKHIKVELVVLGLILFVLH